MRTCRSATLYRCTSEALRKITGDSPTVINIYIDDLNVTLCNSGYGAYIGNVFSRCIMYADEIALISVNCRGLSKMLEIC